MPGIIEFPQVVRDAMPQYGDLFANECQRRHFAEYLTGLMVAERKTVLGINHEFAQTPDQSCPNRFLTDAEWDIGALNQRRLEQLQKDPSTRYSDQGVIPIDNTLIERDGVLIPDAGWFWDHAEERNKIAQDYVFANYVCTPSKQPTVASGNLSQLTATHSARCTSRCTETGNELNADALAGFVASLTPADRSRLVALLTGQAEGGTVQPEPSSGAADRENEV